MQPEFHSRRLNTSPVGRICASPAREARRVEVIMEWPLTVLCGQCHQPIVSGESLVRFKIPGKDTYQFFHYRLRVGDCWEVRLKERK
jgi:hypothetical protein